MLMAGLEAEVAAYVESCEELVDERGYRLVVRNGRAGERTLVTGAGALRVRAPRVNDRREGHRFSSYILPKYARRSPKVGDVLPVLYLRGLSTGDFAPALEGFFGSDAGLSASTIGRLLETWSDEYEAFEDPGSVGVGLCVCVGRRGPFPYPPGGGPAVLSGCDRCESRWQQRTSGLWRTGIGNRPSPGPTCSVV